MRERRYTLPSDTPAILVHPSTTAKNGKFDCTVMSLSVLLDYRPDDNKEHTFEVGHNLRWFLSRIKCNGSFGSSFNVILITWGQNLYKSYGTVDSFL